MRKQNGKNFERFYMRLFNLTNSLNHYTQKNQLLLRAISSPIVFMFISKQMVKTSLLYLNQKMEISSQKNMSNSFAMNLLTSRFVTTQTNSLGISVI